MIYDIFLNYILSFDSLLLLKNEVDRLAILEKLCLVVDKEELHYLWSNYNSPKFIAEKRLSCNKNEYHNTIEGIFTEENYLMAVDGCCFSDYDKHIILQLNRNDLVDILTHFYWELDEVYIFNNDFDWFIAINHHFDIVFYCNEKSTHLCYYCNKIKNDINETRIS